MPKAETTVTPMTNSAMPVCATLMPRAARVMPAAPFSRRSDRITGNRATAKIQTADAQPTNRSKLMRP